MSNYTPLLKKINQWDRWQRLNRAVLWAFRGGLLIAGVALVFTIINLFNEVIIRAQFIQVMQIATLIGLSGGAIAALIWPQSLINNARSFDAAFNLKERTSTAIELREVDPKNPTWKAQQLQDTLQAIQTIKPNSHRFLLMPWREMIAIATIGIAIFGIWRFGQPYFNQAQINQDNLAEIAEQIEALELLTESIENNPELSSEEIEALTQPLAEAAAELAEAETIEEAFAVLNEAQQELSDLGADQTELFEDLQALGETLSQQENSPLEDAAEALSNGDLAAAAEALADLDPSELNSEEAQALAAELSASATAVGDSNPELAAELQQAAEALSNGDAAAAQQALSEASETLTENLQAVEFSQATSQAAAALAQSSQALAQNGNTPGNSGQGTQAGTQPGAGQPGASNQPGQGGQGSGSGQGEFETEAPPGSEVGLSPIDQNNGPGDGGEVDYSSIYAPQLMGGEDNFDSNLPSSGNPGGTTIGESNSQLNESETSLVPYTQVFGTYQNRAYTALESANIPNVLRPIVRQYFGSLEP